MSHGIHLAATALREHPFAPIPLFLSLSHARDVSIPEALAAFLTRYQGVQMDVELINQILDGPHEIILILDGLDEMVDGVDYTRLRVALGRIEEMRARPHVHILLTCRNTFFRISVEEAIVRPTCTLRLLPFSHSRIRQYVES